MLTPEQKAIRATGVGASEIASVAGLHPYKGPLDVWVRKPTASRPAMPEDESDDENPRAEVGSALESPLLALYRKRTNVEAVGIHETFRHPRHPAILASPDGLTPASDGGGVELKVVGTRMLHHWDEGVPEYVIAQAAQNMAVLDREWWDVGALLGGTDFRVWRVHRDEAFEAALVEAGTLFWEIHVVGDTPPEPRDPEEAKVLLRQRYPGSEKAAPRAVEDEDVAEAMRWYAEAKRQLKELEGAKDALEVALCEVIGNDYGILAGGSKMLWIPTRGRVGWQKVAEEIAGGAVPVALMEKHRGDSYRVPRLTSSETKPTKRKR